MERLQVFQNAEKHVKITWQMGLGKVIQLTWNMIKTRVWRLQINFLDIQVIGLYIYERYNNAYIYGQELQKEFATVFMILYLCFYIVYQHKVTIGINI